MEQKISIPRRLNIDYKSFTFLAKLQNDIVQSDADIIRLDFTECLYTDAAFTAYIGALAEIAIELGKYVVYETKEDSAVCNYFKRSGLYGYVTGDNDNKEYINDYAIPFAKANLEESFIVDYIDKILELAPIMLSEDCNSKLFKNIYEMFSNSIDHSHAQYGVYSCGHWMPKRKELVFSIYDTGNGIAKTVQSKVNADFSAKEAVNWALKRGNSTKQLIQGIPRGLGLADLVDFIKLNNGSLRIMTNNICYSVGKSDNCVQLDKNIIGTLLSITIVADYNHLYVVKK